jgi:hypothetical protein
MAGEKAVVTPGWCTNWEAFNTPRIWAMVADEDNAESWRQIAALGAMADTVKDQRSRLVAARDALMQAWPPKKSPGSEALLAKVNALLANMADTKVKADENAAQLGHVLETLRQAKTKIEPLYQKYLDKSDDLIPNWWDNAEDDLDKLAREHMIEAEGTIAKHAEKIVAPSPYKLKVDSYVEDGGSEFPPAGTSSAQGSASRDDRARNEGFVVPHEPPPPLPGQDPILPAAPGLGRTDGPGLADASPLPPQAPLGVASLPSGTAAQVQPVQPGFVIGGGGAFLPSRDGGSSGIRSSVGVGSPTGRGLYPSAKPATPTWLPTGQTQPGVIGAVGQPSRGGQSRPAVRGQSSGSPMLHGGNRDRRQDEAGILLDTDNPWATAEGVAPVIEPSLREPRHDPGPGVIGWRE